MRLEHFKINVQRKKEINQNKLNGFQSKGTQEIIIKTLGLELLPSTATDIKHQSTCVSRLALITAHAIQNTVSKGEFIINHKKNLIQITSAKKSKLVSNNFTSTGYYMVESSNLLNPHICRELLRVTWYAKCCCNMNKI